MPAIKICMFLDLLIMGVCGVMRMCLWSGQCARVCLQCLCVCGEWEECGAGRADEQGQGRAKRAKGPGGGGGESGDIEHENVCCAL